MKMSESEVSKTEEDYVVDENTTNEQHEEIAEIKDERNLEDATIEPMPEEIQENVETAENIKELAENLESADLPSPEAQQRTDSETREDSIKSDYTSLQYAEIIKAPEEYSDQLNLDSGPASVDMLEQDELEKVASEMHPLDELTDQQVIDLLQEMETENKHLFLENILFESFLKEQDPSLLDGFEDIINFLLKGSSSRISAALPVERASEKGSKEKYKLDSYTSITSIAEGKGPKINLSQKTDMLLRAMEENHTSLENYLKKCHIIKRNLKSELEEFSIRETEIREATEIFEYSVVTQGMDKLTQRIPAEKFIRYMEEWLRSAQFQIEKLRLRIATLKVQYKRVSQQLIQRQELGENVHAVDFDQLEIENKHFLEKIEQKNIHLIELKKMNGGANLILSTHKKFLQKQQDDCNKLKAQIDEKSILIEITEKECDQAEEELENEIEKYEHCKKLKDEYSVPDVMEYVRLKAKLFEIKKNIKVWVRRRKIQEIALNTCIREMKNLTGMKDVDPNWFKENHSTEGSLSDEFL